MGDLGRLMPDSMRNLLSANGIETIRQLGMDSIRNVILDILSGKNLRSVTESLTRRRIAALNLAMVSLFLKGTTELDQFVERLPDLAADTYRDRTYSEDERNLAQWILGLTNKAYQNVLRSDLSLVSEYKDVYVEACQEVIARHEQEYGELAGLDFTPSLPPEQREFDTLPERVFWLSSRKDEDREADATLIYGPGQGIRFDIGFIGVGNSEITKDKTTRFRRNAQIAGEDFYMATIIIVDRLGERSKVAELAEQLENGYVVQMSAAFWPQVVARILKNVLYYDHPLADMPSNRVGAYLRRKLAKAPIETFINLSAMAEADKPKPRARRKSAGQDQI